MRDRPLSRLASSGEKTMLKKNPRLARGTFDQRPSYLLEATLTCASNTLVVRFSVPSLGVPGVQRV